MSKKSSLASPEKVAPAEMPETPKPRNLAQMFHYHYHSTLNAETAKHQAKKPVSSPNDWLNKETRMRQIKQNASWYASSFSAALSSSINQDEDEDEDESQESNGKKKKNKPKNTPEKSRRQSLNTLLGMKGVSHADTDRIIRSHIYQIDDEAEKQQKVVEDPKPLEKKARTRKTSKQVVRRPRVPSKRVTQKDILKL